MLLLSFFVMLTGFAALALAMDRHHRDVFARAPTATGRRKLRIGGTVLLILSMLVCIEARGAEFGPVWFIGLAGLAGLLVLLGLAFLPTLRRNATAREARGNVRDPRGIRQAQ